MISNLVQNTPASANYRSDFSKALMKLNDFNFSENKNEHSNRQISMELDKNIDLHWLEDINLSFIEENVITYIAGYVVNKVLSQHICNKYKELLNDGNHTFSRNDQLLILLKDYGINDVITHLKLPTNIWCDSLLTCEKIFLAHVESLFHLFEIKERMVQYFLAYSDFSWFNGCQNVLVCCLKLFATCRIFATTKWKNKKNSNEKKNKIELLEK